MNAASLMQHLCTLGRFKLYWASPRQRFMYPGLHLWTGKRHVRIVPVRKRLST